MQGKLGEGPPDIAGLGAPGTVGAPEDHLGAGIAAPRLVVDLAFAVMDKTGQQIGELAYIGLRIWPVNAQRVQLENFARQVLVEPLPWAASGLPSPTDLN